MRGGWRQTVWNVSQLEVGPRGKERTGMVELIRICVQAHDACGAFYLVFGKPDGKM